MKDVSKWPRPSEVQAEILGPLLDGEVHEIDEDMSRALESLVDFQKVVSTYDLGARCRIKPAGRAWLAEDGGQ